MYTKRGTLYLFALLAAEHHQKMNRDALTYRVKGSDSSPRFFHNRSEDESHRWRTDCGLTESPEKYRDNPAYFEITNHSEDAEAATKETRRE